MEKLIRPFDKLFVVGTDTGVGKTVVSLVLMQYFYDRGYSPFYLKPFQTGCLTPYDAESDANFIYRHVPPLQSKDPADSIIYCLKNPKAPWFAARDEGRLIDLNLVEQTVTAKSDAYAPVIIEAAGGLLVPIDEKTLVVDAVKMIGAEPILVARAGLGTINHTLASIEALTRRGMRPAGVVFSDSMDSPVPEKMVHENMEAVERFAGISVSGVIRKIRDFSNPEKDCCDVVDALFRRKVNDSAR